MTSTTSARTKTAALLIIAVVFAALFTIFIFTTQDEYLKIAAIGVIGFPIALYFSGNQRLFFLFGLVLASPISLSINFMTIVHTGGSRSYSIDLADFFLIPLLLFLLRDIAAGYRQKVSIPSIAYWWVALIALGLISVVFGPLSKVSGFETLRMIKGILIFIVIINECQRVRQFEFVTLALGLGVLLQIIVGLIQFSIKSDLGLQGLGEDGTESPAVEYFGVYNEVDSAYRVRALMGHANLFSAYLALLLPIFVSLLFTNYSKLVKLLLSGILIGGMVVLVLTLSRTGWISFAIAFVFLILFVSLERYLRVRYLALKGFLIVLGFTVLIAASGTIVQRFTQSDTGAFDFRLEWMGVAARMVEAKPVLGFGLNTFVHELAPYTTENSTRALQDRFGEVMPVVHNIYLLVWAEQGTLGLLLLIGFHIHLFRIVARNLKYRLDEKLHLLNIGAACGIIALLVDGLGSFFIRVPACGRIFFIVAALIVAIDYWNKNNYSLRLNLIKNQNRLKSNVTTVPTLN